jgi:iron(III) transport system permease protein
VATLSPTRVAPAAPGRRLRRSGREWPLLLLGSAIALALLAPLVLIVLDARSAGWGEIHRTLFRARSVMLLRNTVVLGVIVSLSAATIGTAAAWLTERTVLPARRVWTVLLVLPVALPDFIVGFAWHSFAPRLPPLLSASIVMTLGTYPLVFLPVAAALRRSDPAMEEAAHSLGVGRGATFFRITLPLIRTAILGGCVLVVLTVISEYGAFEILRYQTFTTEIFSEFQFDAKAAGVLAIPLVILGLLVLFCDALLPRRMVAGTGPSRAIKRVPLGRMAIPTWLGIGALVALGVGIPVGTIIYWMTQNDHATLPASATVATATWTTVRYSALGALIAVVGAVPVALVSFRRRSIARDVLERSTYVTRALPGIVIALSLVFFATRYMFGLYQTGTLLVVAYALLNFPLALVCIKASATQLSPQLIDVGQSLGRHPATVFARVTLPLLGPGLLAGFCLVFLEAMTELTATLVLAPIGTQTLATQFWAFQSNIDYASAAPYALVMLALAVVPGALLALWFDRDR